MALTTGPGEIACADRDDLEFGRPGDLFRHTMETGHQYLCLYLGKRRLRKIDPAHLFITFPTEPGLGRRVNIHRIFGPLIGQHLIVFSRYEECKPPST